MSDRICDNCGSEVEQGASFCRNCGAKFSEPEVSPLAKRCYFCSKPLVGDDAYYFKCNYCGQYFCSDHRLPENHLCRSSPVRRVVPSGMTSSGGYWSSTGRYSSSSSARSGGGGFRLNISRPGRNLAIAIVAGLVIGFVLNFFAVKGLLVPDSAGYVPLSYYFVQWNYLVSNYWIVPLFTSMIVVLPSYLGVVDVAFNALAVIWIDGLFRGTYTAREYYGVFILTGLAGNILSFFLYPLDTISFGASGGIFGLIAGAVTVDYARNRRFNQSLVIWFIFIFFISTFTGSTGAVDIFAHMGGAFVGLVAGYVIGRRGRRSSNYGWS